VTTECRQCVALAASMGEERRVTCSECGATLTRTRDPHRNARVEMTLLARWRRVMLGHASDPCPQVVGDGNTGGGMAHAMNGRPDHIDERNHELRRALAADERLTAMRARSGEGVRYASVVWAAFGHRGEELNMRESCAKAMATEFAKAGELKRWREADAKRDDLGGDVLLIAFGNDLLGAAIDAYERDAWRDLIRVSKRDAWLSGVAEQWAKNRPGR
jgi:hypothetical protein